MLFYGYRVQSKVQGGETFRDAQHVGLYVVRDGSLLRPLGRKAFNMARRQPAPARANSHAANAPVLTPVLLRR